MANDFDHIIVGSGINALVCGALLARRGDKVCILERNDRIGGCIRTEELTLPGYRHDVLSQWYPLFLLSPGYAELGEALHAHGLQFAHCDRPTAGLMSDDSGFVLAKDRAANVAAMNTANPGDGDRYLNAMQSIEVQAELLFATLGEPLWRFGYFKTVAKSLFREGPRAFAANLATYSQTARHWLEQDIGSAAARSCIAPWVLHAGLSPDAAFSAMMAKIICFSLEAVGSPVVEGGSAQLLEAFRGLLEAHGATIITDADVDIVTVSDGRASGVQTADGATFRAARSVICSMPPGQLYGRLLRHEALPTTVTNAVANYRHGRAGMQIHLALDSPPQWTNKAMQDVALIHLCDDVNGVSRAVNQAVCGDLPATPTVVVGQPCVVDPSRAPAGKSILWLQLLELPRTICGDAGGEIDGFGNGEWNNSIAERYADRVLDRVRPHIENLDQILLKRVVLSPADLEQLNMNLVGGDPYGGDCQIDQFLLWRPLPQSRNHTTCIKQLYQIGASTHPGPGLGGGSGYAVAKTLS